MRSKHSIHYAWLICAACMLLFMCVCGMVTTSFSRYLPYLRDNIGLTNTQTETIMLVRTVTSMVLILFVGKFYERVSLRNGMTIASLLLALSCVFFAHARSLWPCLAAAVLMGASYTFGSIYPMSRILANWFEEGRATAMSIATCGSGFTAIILPHVIRLSESSLGLKGAFYVEMGIILAVTLIVYRILRDRPSDIGLEPLCLILKKKNHRERDLKGPFLSGATFCLFLVSVFLIGAGGLTGVNNIALLLKTTGFSDSVVSSAISVFGISMIIGKLSYGILSDTIGGYIANYVFFILMTAGSAAYTLIRPGQVPIAVVSSFLLGIGAAMGTVGVTRWSGDLSSPEQYAESVRIAQLVFNLGGMAFSVVPGFIADRLGNYHMSYGIFTCLLAVSLVLIQLLYRRRMKPERIQEMTSGARSA